MAAVAATLVFASGATAKPPASPLAGAHPMHVCVSQHTGRAAGHYATCDAIGLAKNGHMVALKLSDLHASPSSAYSPLITPDALHTAYSLPTTTSSSSSQTIAIVDAFDNPKAKSDLDAFDSAWGLPTMPSCSSTIRTSCFQKVNQTGGATAPRCPAGQANDCLSWTMEEALDVEAAHTTCQDCKILLVESNTDSVDDLAAAVDTAANLGANIISNSYGVAETTSGVDQSFFDMFAPHYRHNGVAVIASAGDDGFGTQFPADVNDVISVGGTTLNTNASSDAYVSESTWFDSTDDSGTGSGCSAFESANSWQTSANGWSATGCGTSRAVADVSADADPQTGFIIYWSNDPSQCAPPDCFFSIGGTSLSAPIIAGVYGLAANPSSSIASGSVPYFHTNLLHDVTSGANTASSCTTTICHAAGGYDGPTGVGTPWGIQAFVAPRITTISPSKGSTADTVTISGLAFTGATAVKFNGTNAASFSVSSDAQITAVVPGGITSGPLTVTTPVGTVSSPVPFELEPDIGAFSPTHAAEGVSVTITGGGLTGATAVKFNGTSAASFHVDSDTQIKATIAAGTTTGLITVTTPVGTATSGSDLFVVPSITGFSPGSGGAHSTVTVTGTSLNGATSVKLNGTSVLFSVASGAKLTFTVPAGATSGTIQVATPGGTITSAGTFTVLGAPTVTTFSPGSGSIGSPVTVTGTNLGGTVGVEIGSIITVPTSVSATSVTFAVPPGAVTAVIKLLTTSGSASTAGAFTVTS